MDTDEMLELSQEFALLGADLQGVSAVADTVGSASEPAAGSTAALQRMVDLAVKHIDGCDWASITIVTGGHGQTLVSSDPIAALADKLQYELNEGPCLSAAENDNDYLMFDVEGESRWPKYANALADQTPVRSALSFQLVAQESAALNLFAGTAGAFDDESMNSAAIFAAHATNLVALYEARDTAANLQVALGSSRRIGAAIGVLMAHHRVTEDAAFAMLRQSSQRLHRKLRDVALDVVETGTLPTGPSS